MVQENPSSSNNGKGYSQPIKALLKAVPLGILLTLSQISDGKADTIVQGIEQQSKSILNINTFSNIVKDIGLNIEGENLDNLYYSVDSYFKTFPVNGRDTSLDFVNDFVNLGQNYGISENDMIKILESLVKKSLVPKVIIQNTLLKSLMNFYSVDDFNQRMKKVQDIYTRNGKITLKESEEIFSEYYKSVQDERLAMLSVALLLSLLVGGAMVNGVGRFGR